MPQNQQIISIVPPEMDGQRLDQVERLLRGRPVVHGPVGGYGVNDEPGAHAGLRALGWLLRVQTSEDGRLSLIGNDGWYKRGGTKAPFDQQPLEVMGLVEACAEACMWTRSNYWLEQARRCLDWFLGRNDLNIPLYDFKTGGCCDGLQPDGPNRNQGAESTLAWLVSLLSLLKLIAARNLADNTNTEQGTTEGSCEDNIS